MYYFNISDKCPKRITVSSNGDAAIWRTRLGSYNLIRYDDMFNAIYEHDLKNGNFLYKGKRVWFVSQALK